MRSDAPRGETEQADPALTPGGTRSASRLGKLALVGTTCFGLWLFVDASQLYRNAEASPIGVRRSVAMSVLRPLASLDDVTGLSEVTTAADEALGRDGTVGGSVTRSRRPLRTPRNSRPQGNRLRTSTRETNRLTSNAPLPWPPPIRQPDASRPLVLLEIGDSLGEDLGFGLADVLPSAEVRVVQEAVGDTGLSRPDYYDWPAELDQELATYRPQAVVVFLGANDAQSFIENGQVVSYGTALWQADYAARVSTVMEEATEAGAHVLWVGMPIMQSVSLSEDMQLLNSIYSHMSAEHPGVTYFSSWDLFTTSSGSYSEYLPGQGGSEEAVRDPDGIHLTGSGDDLLARALVTAMEEDWKIKL